MNLINGASITSKSPRVTRTSLKSIWSSECYFKVDGSEQIYTDWVMSLSGPLAGYSPVWWQKAVMWGIHNASSSLSAKSEHQAAELLSQFYPDCDAVRFMSDGSSPNEAAVRIARAVTGRKVIGFSGYHGMGTSFPHNPEPSDFIDERRGIPDEMWLLTRQFKWGDFEAVKELPNDIAAIIVEVPPQDEATSSFGNALWQYQCGTQSSTNFLNHCATTARQSGALFIIDDVITGFRVAKGGAAEKYGVSADLYCLGKALGNGLNVSALVGKQETMKALAEGVHYSSTFNGSGLATEVARATLQWILDNEAEIYPTLYKRGEILKDGMNQMFSDAGLPVRMVGNATRPILVDYEQEWLDGWRDRMFMQGFYCMSAPWYLTMTHTESVIERTIEATRQSMLGT